MFPENTKTHVMELRNPEVFQVTHANTERYKKIGYYTYATLAK